MSKILGTTVVAVKRGSQVAIAGDGQVTVGDMILKSTAKKIRMLYHDQVIAGFAGAVADALTLFDKFERQLDQHGGNLRRASVELTKEWRMDRTLHRLEAWLVIASPQGILVLSGDGDVVEPDGETIAIGSGGGYAQAAAEALLQHSNLSAVQIAQASMEIAAKICIYTNNYISMVSLDEGKDSSSNGLQP